MLNFKTYESKLYPDLIERIWVLQNEEDSAEVILPPSQYASIVFPLDGSEYTINGNLIETAQIIGLTSSTSIVSYPKGTKLIGIRFYAHGLHAFIDKIGKELINNTIDLLPLITDTQRYQGLFFSQTTDNLLDEIYDFLTGIFNVEKYIQSIHVRNYYQHFREARTAISIEKYCELHQTNYTSLNRLFTKIIGLTPKKFERLIKFRKSLCEVIDSPDKLTKIGLNSGYFDQAHFVREFKAFVDCTPSAYQSILKTADKDGQVINYNFRLF